MMWLSRCLAQSFLKFAHNVWTLGIVADFGAIPYQPSRKLASESEARPTTYTPMFYDRLLAVVVFVVYQINRSLYPSFNANSFAVIPCLLVFSVSILFNVKNLIELESLFCTA